MSVAKGWIPGEYRVAMARDAQKGGEPMVALRCPCERLSRTLGERQRLGRIFASLTRKEGRQAVAMCDQGASSGRGLGPLGSYAPFIT